MLNVRNIYTKTGTCWVEDVYSACIDGTETETLMFMKPQRMSAHVGTDVLLQLLRT